MTTPAMHLHPTRHGTWQVCVMESWGRRMVVECAKRSDALAFLADPIAFGFGLIGGPR